MSEPEIIQLDKEAFQLVIDALGIKEPRCGYCEIKVTKDNFGFIAKDIIACNSLFCQMKAMDNFEEQKESSVVSNDKK